MKKIFMIVAVGLSMTVTAQREGGISTKMLHDIQKEQELTTADRALMNAIAGNAIDNLAKNHDNDAAFDTHFSIETRRQSITDQKQSGRCWMFSGMNVLRGDFNLRTDSLQVEFSQAYLFFWDQLEKANLMLQGCIDTGDKPLDDVRVQFFFRSPIGDGGTFCGVADLADKYGLVPAEAMPESFSTDNTSKARALIASKLREYGLQLREMVQKGKKGSALEKAKTRMLTQIYHMLQYTIGCPPQKFTYAFKNSKGQTVGEPKEYTPLTFYKEVRQQPLNGSFIMVMNDPRRPYYKTYEVEYDRHTYDGHNWKYVNLPMDDIEQMAIAALRAGHKMYSSYDVGKMLDRKRGFADTENFDYGSLFGTTFPMTKAERISTFDSGSTHAMTLTAVDLDKKGRAVKWKVENSWGTDWGQKGCLIMTDRWMREYMFRLVVPNEFVPEKVMTAYNQQPVMVMPEDPLFMPDEAQPQWFENIKLSGYGMVQYKAQDQEGKEENGFNLRLVRLALEGRAHQDFYWKAQMQINGNAFDTNASGKKNSLTIRLVDLFGEWQKYEFFKVKAGQFKRPFTFENPMHPITQGFMSYSQNVSKLAGFADRTGEHASNGRDIGVQVQGDFLKDGSGRNLLHYQIGAFNGEGINTGDADNRKDIIGGMWVMPVKGLRIGAFGWTGSRAGVGEKNRYALSGEYNVNDWTLRSEYIHSQGWNAAHTADKADGFYALCIAPIQKNKMHVKARYDLYREAKAWGQSKTMYEVGADYLFTKNLQLNVEYARVNDRSAAKHNYNLIDVELDIRF